MVLSACAHGSEETSGNPQPEPELSFEELLDPSEAASEAAPEDPDRSYILNSRDMIRVAVYGHEDLSSRQRIDGNGRIRMSLIGTVDITGKTIRDAETLIEERYREERLLRNPEVTITVEEYSPRFVSVLGNVETPGRIEFPIEQNRLDIVDVISKAGGFNRVARSDRVRLIRVDEDGTDQTFTVNVQEIMQGRDREGKARVYVYPGDSIFVPERLF